MLELVPSILLFLAGFQQSLFLAELMIVSQFTLAAVTKKGNKASFHKAASTNDARALYNELIVRLDGSSINYQSGKFGADMNVSLVNNGPVTFSFNF